MSKVDQLSPVFCDAATNHTMIKIKCHSIVAHYAAVTVQPLLAKGGFMALPGYANIFPRRGKYPSWDRGSEVSERDYSVVTYFL